MILAPLADIADLITDERHAEIQKVGDHHFSARGRQVWISGNFDQQGLRVHVQAAVMFAFARDDADLAAPVAIEYSSPKGFLEELALSGKQDFRGGDEGFEPNVVNAFFPEVMCEEHGGLGVGHDETRTPLPERRNEEVPVFRPDQGSVQRHQTVEKPVTAPIPPSSAGNLAP